MQSTLFTCRYFNLKQFRIYSDRKNEIEKKYLVTFFFQNFKHLLFGMFQCKRHVIKNY